MQNYSYGSVFPYRTEVVNVMCAEVSYFFPYWLTRLEKKMGFFLFFSEKKRTCVFVFSLEKLNLYWLKVRFFFNIKSLKRLYSRKFLEKDQGINFPTFAFFPILTFCYLFFLICFFSPGKVWNGLTDSISKGYFFLGRRKKNRIFAH